MPLAVEKDESLDAFPVRAFGADRVMVEAHDLADLIKQFELWVWNEAFPRS